MNISDFSDDFSGSAFKTIDNSRRVVGKWCELEVLDDGTIDIWVVTPTREPINNYKLTAIEKKLPTGVEFVRLDGEGIVRTTDKALALEIAFLLGVKRRRRYSEEQLQVMRDNFKKNLIK